MNHFLNKQGKKKVGGGGVYKRKEGGKEGR